MVWLYYTLLLVVMLTGMFLAIVGLPGIWLMVLAVAGYAWLTSAEQFVGMWSLVALTVIAGLSEVVEFVAGSAGAKSAGATAKGMIGAIVGGLIGALFLTALIPVPIVGTIFGACLGAGLGALGMEILGGREVGHATRIGVGAFKGRFFGIISKLAFCVVIFVIASFVAFPIRLVTKTQPAIPVLAPTTLPSAAPATQ